MRAYLNRNWTWLLPLLCVLATLPPLARPLARAYLAGNFAHNLDAVAWSWLLCLGACLVWLGKKLVAAETASAFYLALVILDLGAFTVLFTLLAWPIALLLWLGMLALLYEGLVAIDRPIGRSTGRQVAGKTEHTRR